MRLPDWLTRPSVRKARCIAAGTHRPVLIDVGRSKMCMACGTW